LLRAPLQYSPFPCGTPTRPFLSVSAAVPGKQIFFFQPALELLWPQGSFFGSIRDSVAKGAALTLFIFSRFCSVVPWSPIKVVPRPLPHDLPYTSLSLPSLLFPIGNVSSASLFSLSLETGAFCCICIFPSCGDRVPRKFSWPLSPMRWSSPLGLYQFKALELTDLVLIPPLLMFRPFLFVFNFGIEALWFVRGPRFFFFHLSGYFDRPFTMRRFRYSLLFTANSDPFFNFSFFFISALIPGLPSPRCSPISPLLSFLSIYRFSPSDVPCAFSFFPASPFDPPFFFQL